MRISLINGFQLLIVPELWIFAVQIINGEEYEVISNTGFCVLRFGCKCE